MKRIREVREPTRGLADYLQSVTQRSWNEFTSHRSGASFRELRKALLQNQHGLCAYCETAVPVVPGQSQIEHVVPRSDSRYGAAKELDIANLVVCCPGEGKRRADSSRRARRSGLTCGQAKEDQWDRDFADPRTVPSSPPLLSVDSEGRIEVDSDACRGAGWSPQQIRRTIELLNLNAERLCLARERLWNDLVESSKHFSALTQIEEWVRSLLSPDEKDRLPPFFTTTRIYFGSAAECILGKPPQGWI